MQIYPDAEAHHHNDDLYVLYIRAGIKVNP